MTDPHRFDVLIVTAMLDELDAVLALGEDGRAGWHDRDDSHGYPFHVRDFAREDGTALHVAAASFDEMGEAATSARASALIGELDPACLAMCGICAGKKKDVSLGDVIVADRVYSYDDGKLAAGRDADGRRYETLDHNLKTYNLETTWRIKAVYFTRDGAWLADLAAARPPSLEAQEHWLLRTLLEHEQHSAVAPDEHPERQTLCPSLGDVWDRLRKRGLLVPTKGALALTEEGRGEAVEQRRKHPHGPPRDRAFKVHVGPIATGKTVRKDPELFEQLEKLVRKTLGAEMEAAAIGLVAEQLGRRAIIVKAASDHGDGDKDDAFREFAARASATVLLRFLLRNLEPQEGQGEAQGEERPMPGRGRDEGGAALSIGVPSAYGGDFLAQVERASRIKLGDAAQIQRVPAPRPFGQMLRVSVLDQGKFPRIYPVAAAEQVTDEVLDVFLRFVDDRFRNGDSGLSATLVYRSEAPPETIVRRAEARRVLLQSFAECQGLMDFRGYLDWQTRRLERDPIYPPDLYVDQRTLITAGDEETATQDALGSVSELLASPFGRFVLVLGDFGTGKTFLLHELARRMAAGPVVPVLVEMRALEKAADLNALIAQHLALAKVRKIDLEAFRYMLSEGRIALLFDGFDELALRVSYERAGEHFETLIQAAQGSAKVVVTSRTQHFFSDNQARLELARRASLVQGYRLAKLLPFEGDQIRRFLVNRLKDETAAEERFRLLDEVKDLLGLSRNPRLLGFIAEIPEEQLREAKKKQGTITSAGLYKLLLERWLVFEFERAHPRGAPPGLDVKQRWKAIEDLAVLLWQRTERTIHVLDMPEEMVGAVRALASHEIDPGVVKQQIGSGTLLVRDDVGNFSFIHQSVMEWLVALSAAAALKQSGSAAVLGVREISPLMADFLWGLAGRETAERWAARVLQEGAGGVLQKNARLVLERLGVETKGRLKLAGQDLSGQSFAGQSLRNAGLTGAILVDAVLAGADLTGAQLRGAQLQRADLSRANLERADLREADLSHASMLGASLRGAQLAGARLREAKLIGAHLDPGALRGCDVAGAALPGGEKPAAMVSAASFCFALAYSPDGRFLATGHIGSIHLWDVASGTERRVLAGHRGVIRSVAWSPDSASVASGSLDSTVRVWDAASGAERRVLKGHAQGVLSVAYSPDGASLASGSSDATVRVWDAASGAERRVLKGHAQSVWSVAYSPDGASLASGSNDTTVRVWDAASGAERRVLKGHAQSVLSVAYSPDGASLASGSNDTTVRVWDAASGAERRVLKGHAQSVLSVAYSPDGASLASGSDDATVRVWDAASGAERRVLKGHAQSVWSVAWSPDGASLAAGSFDATVRVWDVASGAERRVLKGHAQSVLSVAYSPDGASLASGSLDATVRAWDAASGAERRVLKGHAQGVWSVAYSPDGASLASGSNDTTVRVWDAASGAERRVLKGHAQSVRSVAYSPDGASLASGSLDATVRVWDAASGAERRVLKGHAQGVWSVAWSPDGASLASGSNDTTVRLWDAASGAERRVLKGHAQSVRSVAYSPDGASLASGSEDATVRVWDAASGAERRVLKGHAQGVLSVAYSPDGASVASGSEDATVRVWDVATGAERRVLKGHAQGVWSVAYSPDGASLASGSADATVRVWDVATGACLAVLVSLPEGWVAFRPDGRYRSSGVLTGGFWHAVGLCRFEPGELDPYLATPLRLPDGEPVYRLPVRR